MTQHGGIGDVPASQWNTHARNRNRHDAGLYGHRSRDLHRPAPVIRALVHAAVVENGVGIDVGNRTHPVRRTRERHVADVPFRIIDELAIFAEDERRGLSHSIKPAAVVVQEHGPDLVRLLFAAVFSRGFEEFVGSPGGGIDPDLFESEVMAILYILDRQIQSQIRPTTIKGSLPAQHITPHKLHSESLPIALRHVQAISTCLASREAICGTRCIIISNNTQGEKAITVIPFLLRQIVEIELPVTRCRVLLKDEQICFFQFRTHLWAPPSAFALLRILLKNIDLARSSMSCQSVRPTRT